MTESMDRLGLETEALKTQLADLNCMAESLGQRLVTAFAGAACKGEICRTCCGGLRSRCHAWR